jgi:hypothetical protein
VWDLAIMPLPIMAIPTSGTVEVTDWRGIGGLLKWSGRASEDA